VIRVVWIAALISILCIVLYIPSAYPPDRFLQVVRNEHAANQLVWGDAAASRIMSRMLDLHQVSKPLSEPPSQALAAAAQPAIDAAVANQMAQVSTRLFGNPYFRSIDALFVLVYYRLSSLIEVLPLLLVFLFVVAVDGLVLRVVRSKDFESHSAEMFGFSLLSAIALSSALVVSLFVPFQLHPMLIALSLLLIFFVLSRALSNYHLMR
jgi:cation transport ATPase